MKIACDETEEALMGSRNAPCHCGSGKRLKHCHGLASVKLEHSNDISDEALMAALKRADDEGLRLGEEPPTRALTNIHRALSEFGINEFVLMGNGAPPIVKRAHELNNLLFVPRELQTGGVHFGAFLFRDMFCRLYAPLMYGSANLDFWKLLDLSDFQKSWLAESAEDLGRFTDQVIDIVDFGYGWMEFGNNRELDKRGRDLIWRSHVQLEAAAATATAAYDFRGTIQSSLLGTELALKAGLAALGVSEAEMRSKKIGHNLGAAADRLASLCPEFEIDRVSRVVRRFPDFVASRYEAPPPDRKETGEILMGAQYVASEVTRQFSGRNLRREDVEQSPRQYPK